MKAIHTYSRQYASATALSMMVLFGLSPQSASSSQPEAPSDSGMAVHAETIHQFSIAWDPEPEPLSPEALDYLFSLRGPDETPPRQLNLSYLNDQEMRDVEGKAGQFTPVVVGGAVVAGGVLGGATSIAQDLKAGQPVDWRGAGAATVTGACIVDPDI